MYTYKARMVSIYDGDTFRADVDTGFNIWKSNEQFRLYGIDTPEIRGEDRTRGLEARNWFIEQIPIGSLFYIQSLKDRREKYGRFLAILYRDEIKLKEGHSLNREMVDMGLAKLFMEDSQLPLLSWF